MRLFQVFARRTKQRGFSLVEMLISVLIFAIVMGIVYTYLLQTKKNVISSEEELEAADNAQAALKALRDDIYMIGYGRDVENDQPRLLRCAPYEIIFIADLDRNKENQTDRFGAYLNSKSDAGSASNFLPIRFLTQHSGDWGWDDTIDYGTGYVGAEIVRYSLDYNADGRIDMQDTEDYIVGVAEGETHNQNPADFWLIKEWWGATSDGSGSDFKNTYSGVHPVAFNIHGNLFDPQNLSVDRSDFLYPNPSNRWPPILFTYWGHFIDNITPHNNPNSEDWDGEALDMWGDWSGGTAPSTLPSGPSGFLNNGQLDQSEIQFLMTQEIDGNPWGWVHVLSPEVNMDDDFNGNGITGETRLDQIIRRIGIHITTESGTPDYERPHPELSNLNASPPVKYPFRDYRVSTTINPENLRYEGAPIIRTEPVTPTPMAPTFTPTPIPPTAPPGEPTYTPIPTETPPADTTYTPTPTPGLTDYNDDEIAIGAQNGFLVVGLDNANTTPGGLCVNYTRRWYWIDYPSSVIDLESVNFCDPPGFADKWNDLLYATNDPINPNLFYMKHAPYMGINGFTNRGSIRIGGYNNIILAIEYGNVDNDALPEVFIAYYDQTNNKSYINFLKITGQCGYFNQPVCFPYEVSGRISDMIAGDFDFDGASELAITVGVHPGNTPQLFILDELINCYTTDWVVVYEQPELFADSYPMRIDKGGVLSGSSQYPDLVVISGDSQIAIIPNLSGVFDDAVCIPPMTITYPILKDVLVYQTHNAAEVYDRIAIIGSDQTHHLTHYRSLDGTCAGILEMSDCSGRIYPDNTAIVNPLFSEYIPLNHGTDIPTLAMIIYNQTNYKYELALMGNPCSAAFPDDICFIDLGGFQYYCMTSTKNAETTSWLPTNGASPRDRPVEQPPDNSSMSAPPSGTNNLKTSSQSNVLRAPITQ
ncbi:prepilin-type N-terminal cleavage/methylation domain-containing protein [bacterium]|nr:prepilin-type N-terminal cleavage/methylation domain-containing protein [candidate division CSSED10-310 bacterium]